MFRNLLAFLQFALAFLCAIPAIAQTPQGNAFTYQGALKQNGSAINGNTDMVFALFDAPSAGNPVGSPIAFTAATSNPINVQNGVFDVTLDFGPLPFITLISDQRYLQITVNGTVLTPRTPIQNAPYALQSQTAELAYSVSNGSIGSAQIVPSQVQARVSSTCSGGASISAISANGTVTCQSGAGGGTITGVTAGAGLTGGGTSGNVAIAVATPFVLTGTAGPQLSVTNAAGATGSAAQFQNLSASDAAATISVTTNGTGYAVDGSSPSGVGVHGSGLQAGVQGNSGASSGYGVLGVDAAGIGVYGSGFVAGVEGISTGLGSGVIGNTNTSGYYGVYGNNPVGVGVFGGGTTGVSGTGTSASGYGVYGSNPSNSGVYGTGTYGVYGNGSSYGVFGKATTGLRGESTSTSGYGVFGYDSASSGSTRGVYGQADAAGITGGHGVEGYSGSGVGVYGATSSGWAGYFDGNVSISKFAQVFGNFDHEGNLATFQNQVWIYGTLSKPAGSFKIDDPLDPANKYLYHSFVESPDMKNIYDGVATLDARGEAWVDLPDYFEALNQEFRYQLTALGRSAPSLYIADEVSGNRFHIAGGGGGQRVSWQVTGTRHDAYAQAHRIPNEVEKTGDERGKYIYPELFNQPASLSLRHMGQPATNTPTAPTTQSPAETAPTPAPGIAACILGPNGKPSC